MALNTKKPVIQLDKVNFSYKDALVLENVTFQIFDKEMIGVVGPNGSGKTTLLRLILGLLEPERGKIKIFGKNPSEAAPMVGYVPQHMQFDASFPANVLDVVLMGQAGRTILGFYPKKVVRKAKEVLETVGLADCSNRSFADLSGGQRQRVLIARALSTSPRMLLFDEPTANVDSFAGEKIFNLLDKLNKKMTILVVSHDIGFINQHINRVLCVNRQVNIHQTSVLDGHNIVDLYGKEMALIHHDTKMCGENKAC